MGNFCQAEENKKNQQRQKKDMSRENQQQQNQYKLTGNQQQSFGSKEKQLTQAQQQKQTLRKIQRVKESLQILKSYIQNKPKEENTLLQCNIKCMFGNQGHNYCIDIECSHPSVTCLQKECQCHINHRDCQTSKKISKVNERMNLSQIWFKKIHLQFLNMEVFLIDMQRKIAQQLEKLDFTKKFVDMIKNDNKIHKVPYMTQDKKKSIMQLTGRKVNHYLDLCSRENFQIGAKQLQNLHNLYNITEQKIIKHFQSAKKIVYQQLKVKRQGLGLSKIITNQQQIKKMNEFLQEINYRSMSLLFRGSQHKFSMMSFHDKCDNKPNLLYLVENEFGFKYGAYCPCPVSLYRLQQWERDVFMTSFVFSLDLNKKAKIIEQEYAINNGKKYQPQSQYVIVSFGNQECCSLKISANSGSTKTDNWIKFYPLQSNSSYQRSSDPPSMLQSCGTQQRCKLREFEVYQLFL